MTPQSRVVGAIPYAGHLDIFAIASDGIVYTRGWTSGAGWDLWHRLREEEQGFVAATSKNLAVSHRVNRQIELFAESQNGSFFRAWWS